MSNSPLVKYTQLSPNHSGKRTHAIDRISIHCVVGHLSLQTIGACFAPASRQASCNYGVDDNGNVGMYVEECNRSWCTSSNANDQRAVTIETASDKAHPYKVTDAALAGLIELCTDICRRNGKTKAIWFGDKDKSLAYQPKANEIVFTVHRWFANKSCPGDYIYERLGDIAAKVNAKLGGASAGKDTDVPATPVSKVPYKVRITATDLRIRKGPGTDKEIVQVIAPGVYTIVSEATGKGATLWGKLKSGIGWVSLDYCKKI